MKPDSEKWEAFVRVLEATGLSGQQQIAVAQAASEWALSCYVKGGDEARGVIGLTMGQIENARQQEVATRPRADAENIRRQKAN